MLALEVARTDSSNEAAQFAAKDIIVDHMLREQSFGSREGFSRTLATGTTDRLRNERPHMYQDTADYGLEETEEQLWRRMQAWMKRLIIDVVKDDQQRRKSETRERLERYHVLVSTHPGSIRQTLHHMVGNLTLREHPDASYHTEFHVITPMYLLTIPSASMTQLDLILDSTKRQIVTDARVVELTKVVSGGPKDGHVAKHDEL